VTDAQDHHIVAANAITDDVGMHRDQLTHGGSAHRTATMRKIHQASPSLEQSCGHALGSLRIEIEDVIVAAPGAGMS